MYYLKTLNVVESMKNTLFNDRQKYCFDFLKKPNLLNSEEVENLVNQISVDKLKNCNILVKYFSDKINKNEINDIDKKLLGLVDRRILNVLQ